MIGKTLLSVALVALTLSAGAAEQVPPNPQEQAMLQQMREAAKRQGMTFTPEMEVMALQRMHEMQANVLGMQMAIQSMHQAPASAPPAPPPMAYPTPAASPAAPVNDSSGWLAAINAHKSHAHKAKFEDARDGFIANGQPWLDPEGSIQWYGADRATGNVTYLVRQGDGDYAVRFANVNSSDAPVTVGSVHVTDGRQAYNGLDGTQLSGEQLIPLADGLLATRGGAFFRYQFGSTPVSHMVPAEYQFLYAQRGDVVGTGYVLAMKKTRQTLRQAFRTFAVASGKPCEQSKGTMFGSNDPDFALVDIQSGKLVVLPRSEAATEIAWDTRFDCQGKAKPEHFFNAIDWQQTSIGPVAIVFSDNGMSVYAVQLDTGKQATVFHRAMGINEWRDGTTDDGGLAVEAQLGFKHETVEDVRTNFAAGQ